MLVSSRHVTLSGRNRKPLGVAVKKYLAPAGAALLVAGGVGGVYGAQALSHPAPAKPSVQLVQNADATVTPTDTTTTTDTPSSTTTTATPSPTSTTVAPAPAPAPVQSASVAPAPAPSTSQVTPVSTQPVAPDPTTAPASNPAGPPPPAPGNLTSSNVIDANPGKPAPSTTTK